MTRQPASTKTVQPIGAVGVDYSLFIISRYREERRHGLSKIEAIARTGATASRAAFFSGTIVVLAIGGMFFMPVTVFSSMATGGILVVASTVLASLTLLPAVLSLMGDKVDALRIPFLQRKHKPTVEGEEHGFWNSLAKGVMKRPVVSLVLAGGLLVAAAIPYFDIRTGQSGISTLPDSIEAKKGYSILAKDFSAGMLTPTGIVVDGAVGSEPVQAAILRLQETLKNDSALGPSQIKVNQAQDLAVVSVMMSVDPNGAAAADAVRRIRNQHMPAAFKGIDADVMVTGSTAFSLDVAAISSDNTPKVFAFVLTLSFVFLTIVFRSIIVPIKAIIMNLLSVGAAYGLLVLVTQKGVGADLLGLQRVDVVESWIPVFLFAMLFGLSMDYHVFLISRIREHYDHTRNNSKSVAFGLRSTAGIITGAAVIMVAVFGGFAAGELVMFQQLGFGLAVAVFIDATIVRSILVPATMQLLGDRNWYLPRFLSWLPDLRVDGAEVATKPAPAIKIERAATGSQPVPVLMEQS